MSSLIFRPFSRTLFRRANREIANAWWSACDLWSEHWWNIEIRITGDEIPVEENALVVSNHQTMADITTLFRFARSKHRLGDLKWFVKDPLKYIPGIGWGMVFLDCVFLKRDWKSDRTHLDQTLSRFKEDNIPIWTISFVEGTRIRPHKLARSQEYARAQGLEPLNHLLMPRHKGFVASVQGLRGHLDAVYDATIGYEQAVPSLWQWAQGYVKRVNVHVKRHSVTELPMDDEGLQGWLYTRFLEKDERLERYYQTGNMAD